jgi:CRP/FNR family transcriptional regulator, cyclic AMP receptor protein
VAISSAAGAHPPQLTLRKKHGLGGAKPTRMSFREGPPIRLLEAHPDLRQGLDAQQAAAATARAVARTVNLRTGAWAPSTLRPGRGDDLALLVIEGVLSRTVTLAGRTVVELFGAEDLLPPRDDHPEPASVPAEVTWTVLRPARVALLDERFAARIAPWPPISAALLTRTVSRSRWLVRHLAILDQPRLDVRLVLLFWELADRWGRVAPGGVSVPLPLTHQMLGRIIRAQRPSVTATLGQLRQRGFLSRAPDGSWVIHGDAAGQLRELGATDLA